MDRKLPGLAEGSAVVPATYDLRRGRRRRDLASPSLWIAASLPAVIFLGVFLTLCFYAAPEHDDFCFASMNVRDGFIETLKIVYDGMGGRLVPFSLLQAPAAISRALSIPFLLSYSLTLAFCLLVCAGSLIAIVRRLPPATAFFLTTAFAATVIAASPSLHDLLYWLPAVACYTLAGAVSIAIFSECIQALSIDEGISKPAMVLMATGGLTASMCNEFTAFWLLGVLAASLLARALLDRRLQVGRHGLIAAAVLIGLIIVVAAPGNAERLTATGGFRSLSMAAKWSLKASLQGLWKFVSCPPVIGWLLATGFVTAYGPRPASSNSLSSRDSLWIAAGITAISLVCCYFEYFMHMLSSGVNLVPRAQNQALIFLLFGVTSAVSMLAATRIRSSERPLGAPVMAGSIIAIALCASPATMLLRSQMGTFADYRQESITRDELLRTSSSSTVVIHAHRFRPSIVMETDIKDSPVGCIASFYGRSKVVPATTP